MTDNPYSVSVQRSQYNPIQSTQALGGVGHELQPNGHLPGVDSAGHYATMNYINAPPPIRYYDDLPHLTRDPGEQGNRSQHQLDGHRLPEAIRYTPVIPAVLPSHVSFRHNIAGPFQGNPNLVHSGTSVDEDLKSIASRSVHNPGSRVDKLRAKQSRSGTVKVLILLEIDDTM